MTLDTEITVNFYDEETGELIEIEDGYVVGRHQSILSKQQRLTINQERAQRLVTQQANNHYEKPYVPPQMFPSDKPVPNSGPYVAPTMFESDKPVLNDGLYVAPVMTWD